MLKEVNMKEMRDVQENSSRLHELERCLYTQLP
jgi:hypothetical protein